MEIVPEHSITIMVVEAIPLGEPEIEGALVQDRLFDLIVERDELTCELSICLHKWLVMVRQAGYSSCQIAG